MLNCSLLSMYFYFFLIQVQGPKIKYFKYFRFSKSLLYKGLVSARDLIEFLMLGDFYVVPSDNTNR
jgi:hypothetical protein